jgi:pyrimidine-nucleoside phosphorylase
MRGEAMTAGLRPAVLIGRKRDGGTLTEAELSAMVHGYLGGDVSEGQMAALLMAGVLRGFTDDEAVALTRILTDSGETLDLSGLSGPTVDKHSTGGVADGTTLLVAPLLAACGAQLVKLSGRGLGHTGGTLDKLEAIPGMRVDLAESELLGIAERVGCVVAAQTDRLVPADRALYALRDVTGTVASTALIASSVMSKKLAAGAETIVLDVKTGDGAFMATLPEAVDLAELCVDIGVREGRRCVALVTAMDQPLGRGVGNGLEVVEAVELLQDGPRGRLADVAMELAVEALASASDLGRDVARSRLERAWKDGEALARLQRMIEAQGGDPRVCEDPRAHLPAAPVTMPAPSPAAGTIAAIPARAVGEIAAALGAGRATKQDTVDPSVGIELAVEVGTEVERGQPLGLVHARSEADAARAAETLGEVVEVGAAPPPASTVLHRVGR